MENETIIVLKDSEGPIGGFVDYIMGMYRVPIEGFDIESEYRAYVVKLYADNGFNCHIDDLNMTRIDWKKGEKKRKKELREMKKRLAAELTVTYYVEQVLKAHKVFYTEFYI